MPRHDDRQHRRAGGAGQPGRAVLRGRDVAGAAGALREHPDQPAAAQHPDAARSGRRVRHPAPHRELADPRQQPGQRAAEHLLLDQEHHPAPEQPEQQRPVDERAVVGDQHDRPGAGIRSPWCTRTRQHRAEAPAADPAGEVVQPRRRTGGPAGTGRPDRAPVRARSADTGAALAVRSRQQPALVRELRQPGEHGVHAQLVGVEHDRVGGGVQRRRGAGGVELVAAADVGEHGVEVGGAPGLAVLRGPRARPGSRRTRSGRP